MAEDKLKNIEAELEAPADFTSPEILYADPLRGTGETPSVSLRSTVSLPPLSLCDISP